MPPEARLSVPEFFLGRERYSHDRTGHGPPIGPVASAYTKGRLTWDCC